MDKLTTPLADGFYMPGEYEPHRGCLMIWPSRPGSWPFGAKAARKAFTQIIRSLAKSEEVFVAAGEKELDSAKTALAGIDGVTVFLCETDDAWARDVGPTFLVNQNRTVRAVNWEFNAWGGTYDGLYASWDKDNAFAKAFAQKEGYRVYDAAPFVLEGGAIHCDGEGTALVTEACLLSKGRNPELSQKQIEEKLITYLGVQKVIWIPYGIYNDETNEHVDNVCAFVRPGEVVLAWTDKKDDPQYDMSMADYERLLEETDAKGRKLVIHKLPIPDHPVLVEEEDLLGYEFEDGEDTREAGERLAASYVNFYVSNGAVLVPAFGGDNAESDQRAARILQTLFKEREVISIPARDILLGGGNIHCITQQIPKEAPDCGVGQTEEKSV